MTHRNNAAEILHCQKLAVMPSRFDDARQQLLCAPAMGFFVDEIPAASIFDSRGICRHDYAAYLTRAFTSALTPHFAATDDITGRITSEIFSPDIFACRYSPRLTCAPRYFAA